MEDCEGCQRGRSRAGVCVLSTLLSRCEREKLHCDYGRVSLSLLLICRLPYPLLCCLIPKNIHLGLFRSDYLLHVTGPEGPLELKQVEFNTISSSFGALSNKVTDLHR